MALASTADERPGALSCTYASRRDNALLTHERCAWKDKSGATHVVPAHLRRLRYDRFGLAAVGVDGFYYARRDGRLAPTMTFDNGAEPFANGRARSPVNGRIGFIDRRLRLAIPARYDGAYRFDHGFAVVCRDCVSRTDGEHSWYEGGVWGCVDTLGREPFPLRALKPGEALDALCPKGR